MVRSQVSTLCIALTSKPIVQFQNILRTIYTNQGNNLFKFHVPISNWVQSFCCVILFIKYLVYLDFLGTFSGLSPFFRRTFSGLSQGFPRTFSGLSLASLEHFIQNGLPGHCLDLCSLFYSLALEKNHFLAKIGKIIFGYSIVDGLRSL